MLPLIKRTEFIVSVKMGRRRVGTGIVVSAAAACPLATVSSFRGVKLPEREAVSHLLHVVAGTAETEDGARPSLYRCSGSCGRW